MPKRKKQPKQELAVLPKQPSYAQAHLDLFYNELDALAKRLADEQSKVARTIPNVVVDAKLEYLRFLKAGVDLALDLDALLETIHMKRLHELPELLKFALLLVSTQRTHLLTATKSEAFLVNGDYAVNQKVLEEILFAYEDSNAGEVERTFEEDYLLTLAVVNATGLALPYNEELYTWVMKQAMKDANLSVRF
jgi:hypothetical protein